MLGPLRLKHVVRSLEQIIEPLCIRKPYLIHHRNHHGILVIFLDTSQVVKIFASLEIKTTVFLDGVSDIALVANSRIGITPTIAELPLVNRTCSRIIFGLSDVAFPSDFIIAVERHLDLTHTVRHQIIHDKGILLDKTRRHDIRHIITFHMTDGNIS